MAFAKVHRKLSLISALQLPSQKSFTLQLWNTHKEGHGRIYRRPNYYDHTGAVHSFTSNCSYCSKIYCSKKGYNKPYEGMMRMITMSWWLVWIWCCDILPCRVLFFRVIAFAGKSLGRLSGRAVASLTRTEVESKLTLLGCLVFANKLKVDTKSALGSLASGRCRCIIATGDNPLTAMAVAKECGLVRNVE